MRLLDSYLELGVVGMVRAAEAEWFGGHSLLRATTEDRQNRYWGIDNYFTVTSADADAHDIPVYDTTGEMAKKAFDELHTVLPGRVIEGVRYHFAGEVVHSITHGQALTDLERFGYGELVEAGLVNHRVQLYLDRQRPDFVLEDEVKEPAFGEIYAPEYWSKTYRDPHALKLPYAALDLLRQLPDGERRKAEYNVCKLLTIMDSQKNREASVQGLPLLIP